MFAITDYKYYYSNNLKLINELRENHFVLYERIKDVLYSLNYIAENYEKYMDHESAVDFEDIFEVGFSYLHSELEQIKVYYENNLNGDFILFKKYDPLINLLLYIEDFTETLKEQEYFTEKREKTLDEVFSKVERIIVEKLEWNDDDFDEFNDKILSCVPYKVDITTTQEIFTKIAEEIMIIKG